MPEPILILGLISAGYFALKSGHRDLLPSRKPPTKSYASSIVVLPDGMSYSRRSLRLLSKARHVAAAPNSSSSFSSVSSRTSSKKKKLPSRISSGDAELKRFRKWLDSYKDKIESRHRTLPTLR